MLSVGEARLSGLREDGGPPMVVQLILGLLWMVVQRIVGVLVMVVDIRRWRMGGGSSSAAPVGSLPRGSYHFIGMHAADSAAAHNTCASLVIDRCPFIWQLAAGLGAKRISASPRAGSCA